MGSKLLLFMLIGMTAAYEYYLEVKTADSKWAGTDGPVYVELEGTGHRTLNFGEMRHLDKNSLKHYSKHSDDYIGSIECISIRMGTSNAWRPEYLAAWSSYDHEKAYVYSVQKYYSTDAKEGPNHVKLCKEGDTTYTITTTTSTKKWADSDDIRANVEIIGRIGSTETGIMDKKFEKGKTDTFVFHGMKDVGHIQCIVVKARAHNKWLFTKITVQKNGSPNARTFYNVGETWMSDDTKEGEPSLKLCDHTWTWTWSTSRVLRVSAWKLGN